MRANLGTGLNDATSTKQNFNATTGLVVLAFDDDSDTYWHHDTGFGAAADPVAGFTAAPTSGTAPVTVNFTNTSTGTPTLTYAWDFGDPARASTTPRRATNPSHTYSSAGTYTVKLTTTNGNSVSDTNTQANLITVAGPTSTDHADAGCRRPGQVGLADEQLRLARLRPDARRIPGPPRPTGRTSGSTSRG